MTWTPVMEDALIDAYLHQHTIVNRVGGSFTSHALENIVKELKEKFPDKPINKEKAQNRIKVVKRTFTQCYDVFKNGMSGCSWNPSTEMWSAELEVWQQLIETLPAAAEWRNKRVRNYEKLAQLYGQDRATGQFSEDPIDIFNRRRINRENEYPNPIFDHTIDDVDFGISQNNITLENIGDDDVHIGTNARDELHPRSNSEPPSSSKIKRIKRSNIAEDLLTNLSSTMEIIANGMKEASDKMANALLAKNATPSYDVYTLLEEMEIEQNLIDDAYVFLSDNPSKLESLVKCPIHRRKVVLEKFMKL